MSRTSHYVAHLKAFHICQGCLNWIVQKWPAYLYQQSLMFYRLCSWRCTASVAHLLSTCAGLPGACNLTAAVGNLCTDTTASSYRRVHMTFQGSQPLPSSRFAHVGSSSHKLSSDLEWGGSLCRNLVWHSNLKYTQRSLMTLLCLALSWEYKWAPCTCVQNLTCGWAQNILWMRNYKECAITELFTGYSMNVRSQNVSLERVGVGEIFFSTSFSSKDGRVTTFSNSKSLSILWHHTVLTSVPSTFPTSERKEKTIF